MRFSCVVAALHLSSCPYTNAFAQSVNAEKEPPGELGADSAPNARALFESGRTHYEAGEYALAVARFRAAYEQAPSAPLLYNLAQAERLNGDCELALLHYETFRRTTAEMPPEDLDSKITKVRACAEAAVKAREAPGGSSEQHAPARRGAFSAVPEDVAQGSPLGHRRESTAKPGVDTTREVLGFAALGGAVISAALGAVQLERARDAADHLDSVNREGATWSERHAAYESSLAASETAAIGLFIASGVLAGTGTWLLVVIPTESRSADVAFRGSFKF